VSVMRELTKQRKVELASQLEAAVNRFIDKQWVMSDQAGWIAKTEEERSFLENINYTFVVYVE